MSLNAMRVTIGLIVLAGPVACQRAESAEASAGQPARAAPEAEVVGYERGDWWRQNLNELILSAGHIVISHGEAQSAGALIECQPNARSKADALRLARKLSRELTQEPEHFAAAARQYSDEPLTAASGGSLGVFSAMAVPPQFVDALANLNEGQVSRPVETPQGYHIIRRLRVPAAESLGIARIVIKYDGAFGWRRTDRDVPPHTRQQARELAQRVADELRQTPGAFERLAMQYSESDDARRGGDLGVWSTYQGGDSDFMKLSVASQLSGGGISEPFDIQTGLQIVQRRAVVPQPNFAASVITVGYAGSQISRRLARTERTAARAKELATRIARDAASHPDRFDRLSRERCDGAFCGVQAWSSGHGLTDLEVAIGHLKIGEIAPAPIDTPLGFLVIRRDDAVQHPPPALPPTRSSFTLFAAAAAASAAQRGAAQGM